MTKTPRKGAQWTSVVANARAIRGAVGECLKLSDQLHDPELKAGAIGFVNGMEFLIASLLGEETRVRQRGASEKELVKRLHESLIISDTYWRRVTVPLTTSATAKRRDSSSRQ
jgi:hypothetical protein